MTTSFVNRIIVVAMLTFTFATNGMAKEPSLRAYNGIEYFTWNIDDNGTLHVTLLQMQLLISKNPHSSSIESRSQASFSRRISTARLH